MGFAKGETVTVHRRTMTGQNADGNDTFNEASTTYPGVAVYPRESTELVQGQTTNVIGLVAVFKPAIAVSPTDQVTARGKRYEIDADPGQFDSALTGTNLTQLNLRRVEG